MNDKYYNGQRILDTLDINKNVPAIYLVCGDRSAGKTVYFNKLLTNRFLKNKEQFVILYRYKYELSNCAEQFFGNIQQLFFSDYEMRSVSICNGNFRALLLNDELCGFALPLNAAEMVKKNSHIFYGVKHILFDEFQSETGNYLTNEVDKFISVHNSIARGSGEQSRDVPVYMISNRCSLINPYFMELGISDRLRSDTKILRGVGFVFENCVNNSAREAQKLSQFNRAFSGNKYVEYSTDSIYLNDNLAFIEKLSGKFRYICNIVYNEKIFAIKMYEEKGLLYVADKVDATFPVTIAITTEDHNINYIMLNKNSGLINGLRGYFDKGCFRFRNLECKNALLKFLSI